ncbi:MAG: hypothetical protein IT245_03005, partial [Bacteroidia bacterium]|nr:hypothetical protein [Bacteroidia bacterium]
SIELDYSFEVHANKNIIYLHQGKDVVQAYDYDLNKDDSKTIEESKYASKNGSTYSFMDDFAEMLANLNLKFGLNLNDILTTDAKNDTSKMENYAVTYQKVAKEVGIFKKYYKEFTILSRNGTEYTKEIPFDFSSDKLIIEAEFKELDNSNLLIFGKYVEKTTSTNAMYGLFTCVVDKN